MAPNVAWLPALRRYVCVIVVGNLAWEFAQLPLYTLWKTSTPNEIIFAMLHCTAGDMLIAGTRLVGSLLLLGTSEWPRARFLPVAAATSISGVSTTAYSEHLNTARGAWTYSDLMPVLSDTGIGLAPLAQWIVIPILAFAAVRSSKLVGHLDLPIMGITTSGVTPDYLARSGRRAS
jgi:hypothetical protein